MGVVHKLKSEVKDFVLEQKKNNPALSCRKLSALVLDQFQTELSKSSINMIIKEAGLSAPVGRTPKKKRHHIVMPVLPVLLEDASAKPAIEPEAKKEEAEKTLQLEAENKLREEEIKKAQAEQAAQEEAKLKAEEEARQKEAQQKEEEALKQAKEEEAKQREDEKRKAEEEASKKAEEEKWFKLAEEERKIKDGAEELKPAAHFTIDRFPQLEDSGIILLRVADSIIGVSKQIASVIKTRALGLEGNFEAVTENIIYLPLLQDKIEKPLIDKLSGYLNEIENIKVMNLDISRIMTLGLQEARCVKVILSDGSNLFLDAQFYSVWSTPQIPYDFASPIHNLKKRINKYFNTDSPLILFNAPGYDMPSQEFFAFLAGLEGKGNYITSLILYGNKFEELEVLPVAQAKKRNFIFAIWPWQFTECRKVKSLGDFRQIHLDRENKDLYIADIEMELEHPEAGKQVTLYGYAVKLSPHEKTRMVILSNLTPEAQKAETLIAEYFSHWPNLEEAFQDYSRKIELFTYTANSQRFFSAENLNLGLAQVSSVKDLFKSYLIALDAFVRWHLLPAGYEDKELSLTKEWFYDLKLQLAKNNGYCTARFILPAEYSFEKDLEYLCRRINEREIELDGKRFLFSI